MPPLPDGAGKLMPVLCCCFRRYWSDGPITDLCYEGIVPPIVDMNVVRTGSGDMVEYKSFGEHGTFNRDELNALSLDLAEAATDELMAKQREVLGDSR